MTEQNRWATADERQEKSGRLPAFRLQRGDFNSVPRTLVSPSPSVPRKINNTVRRRRRRITRTTSVIKRNKEITILQTNSAGCMTDRHMATNVNKHVCCSGLVPIHSACCWRNDSHTANSTIMNTDHSQPSTRTLLHMTPTFILRILFHLILYSWCDVSTV
jgi:hypothetical protein